MGRLRAVFELQHHPVCPGGGGVGSASLGCSELWDVELRDVGMGGGLGVDWGAQRAFLTRMVL